VYTSAVDVIRKTWKNEGLRGIQRGLPPGYVYQVSNTVFFLGPSSENQGPERGLYFRNRRF
jgi:hypothetical protein